MEDGHYQQHCDEQGSALRSVRLSDKYDLSCETVFVSGAQALVRMCLLQSEQDRDKGLNTAGYVTGYRGSPLGSVDMQFSAASASLAQADITFHPALNEDMAATAVWGTQQIGLHQEQTHDGVFSIWYGKGPGVDRTGDVFRHANLAGTDKHGGVIALLGDDHAGESSTVCHQSEFAMVDAMIPVLNPVNLEELVSFGLHGWQLSRYSGLWVGIKCVKDNIESTASASLGSEGFSYQLPQNDGRPAGGLNIRRHDGRHQQEDRLHQHKHAAAHAYVRANRLDRIIYSGGSSAQFGIVSTGKAYMDVLQALSDLGIDEARAEALGLRLYKIGMSWPLEPEGLMAACDGLSHLLVVEEKRGLMEQQIRSILYDCENPPQILGKTDKQGRKILNSAGVIDSVDVALAITDHLLSSAPLDKVLAAQAQAMTARSQRSLPPLPLQRAPYFCAGCPHNSSTILPEDARGYAGIGCHWMALTMERGVEGYTHMGGEGANWIGEAGFSTREHVFQNMGDGTFNHSGLMAIRAAVAAGVNITFKLLYNDAVAMTGGQKNDGDLTASDIAHQMASFPVQKIAVVTEDVSRHDRTAYPRDVQFYDRSQLQSVQSELSQIKGVTALIYDQTCATEKRRRRKRGLMDDPDRHVVINPEVCEGCGDCGVQSNCVAILPLETELGRKRRIDRSACNKDISCIDGFCPSFVTVSGGRLRAKKPDSDISFDSLPPPPYVITQSCSILLAGVGGTGVVTLGAILGMAAHLEDKGCGIIDMAGLAQKGGAVLSHIRLAPRREDIAAIRIGPGGADLLLGCDSLVSADNSQLKLLSAEGYIVANSYEMPTGHFTRNADERLPSAEIEDRLRAMVPDGHVSLADITSLAVELTGQKIASNIMLLGIAVQRGLIPLSVAAIEQAITLNGVDVRLNLTAFRLGRLWVSDPQRLEQMRPGTDKPAASLTALSDIVTDRAKRLTDYQNSAYAEIYRDIMSRLVQADPDKDKRAARLAARYLYKMMAIKDEYEVGRLYSDGRFKALLAEEFEGDYKVTYHLAPPFLSSSLTASGRPEKKAYQRGMNLIMAGLARARGLRGSVFDVFGYTSERKQEREWRDRYIQLLEDVIEILPDRDKDLASGDTPDSDYEILCRLISVPEQIRGFGPVREQHFTNAAAELKALMQTLGLNPEDELSAR